MIRVDIKEKRFGNTHILGAIAFSVAKGETLAIVGPSGAGKSTLLRMIAGLDTRFQGRIDAPSQIGLVFQEPTLLPWRRVIDNLTLMHPDQSKNSATAMLERVGLAGRETAWPRHLSLGQQRRLALARAFMGAPDLLILDEPFVSLDPKTHSDMIALTKSLIAQHKPATLLVTHEQTEAETLGDRICALHGTPATLHPG